MGLSRSKPSVLTKGTPGRSVKDRFRHAKRSKLINTFAMPLDMNDLELLATWFIPRTIEDQSGLVFRGLATRSGRSELKYVAIWLNSLVEKSVSSKEPFPTDVLAEIQFNIGMIFEELEDYAEAAKAFTACLYLQTQREDPPARVAKTLFRLGHAYGRIDQAKEKKKAWKRAFALMGYHMEPAELDSLCARRGMQAVEEETASSDC